MMLSSVMVPIHLPSSMTGTWEIACFIISLLTLRIVSSGLVEMTFFVMMSPHLLPLPEVRTWSILLTVESLGSTLPRSIFAIWACETPASSASSLWVSPASFLILFSVDSVTIILITLGYFLYTIDIVKDIFAVFINVRRGWPVRNILIDSLKQTPLEEQKLEIVERKGLGHPDFICDAIMDRVSVELSRAYLDAVRGDHASQCG